jgi:hypothetical protein
VDNDFNIDLADIRASIRTSDVLAIRFVSLGHRLLLDFRATEIDGPLVKVVEPVGSIEERYRHLKKLRPRLPAPEKIVVIWWTRFASSLATTGVWDEVMQRVSEAGHVEAVKRAEETLEELVALERTLARDAIAGNGFKTLWSRSPAPR